MIKTKLFWKEEIIDIFRYNPTALESDETEMDNVNESEVESKHTAAITEQDVKKKEEMYMLANKVIDALPRDTLLELLPDNETKKVFRRYIELREDSTEIDNNT